MCAVIRSGASHHRERGRDSHVTGRLQSVSAKSSEVGPVCVMRWMTQSKSLGLGTARCHTGPASHTQHAAVHAR